MKRLNIDCKKVINLYNTGISPKKVGEYYSVSESTVWKILKDNNITTRKGDSTRRIYEFRSERFFEEIDSEEKAYFLGLIFADGSLNDKLKTLQLTLVEEDKKVLIILNDLIYKNRPLRLISPKNINHKNQIQVTVTSKLFYKDLLSYNLCQNKSVIGGWIDKKVPFNLINHFIRGYMDGDGCIYIDEKRKTPSLTFTGHNSFIIPLRDLISEGGNLSTGNKCKSYISTLSYGGNIKVKRILDWIYKDATIFLVRKFKKYKTVASYSNIGRKSRELLGTLTVKNEDNQQPSS